MNRPSVVAKDKTGGVTKQGRQFTLVPPDGGYGWTVAFAHFVILGTSIPVQLIFGLLYRDVFIELDFTPTVVSVLLNVNLGVGYGFALFNGPLIRRFGYRKMAVIGSTLLSSGMALTSVAVTTTQFMIMYGIIASLGAATVLQSSQVAINSYFKEKKSKAMGIAMTAVGACTILTPQLTVALMKSYGSRGACLVLAGVTMQGFVGAALLLPVKHHMKRKLLDPEQPPLQSQDETNAKDEIVERNGDVNASSYANPENVVKTGNMGSDGEKTDDVEEPLLESDNKVPANRKPVSCKEGTGETAGLLGVLEESPKVDGNANEDNTKTSRTSLKRSSRAETTGGEEAEKKGIIGVFLSKISTVLDLSILTNAVYANIIASMSLAFASETNFSVMTPLILASMGYGAEQVAAIMSTMAIIDIVARFLTPFAVGRFKIKERTVYFISVILLVSFRSILFLLSTFESMLILAVGLGIAKGIRNVYIHLVIPSYVPIERLASAIGIQMALSALLFVCFGPILGATVEKGGDYSWAIIVINAFTLVAIVMWLAELVAFRKKRAAGPAAGEDAS